MVLLAGAGVDTALAGRPGWASLVATIGSESVPVDLLPGLAEIAGRLPVEAADALRVVSGRREFDAAVQRAVPPTAVSGETAMARALANLTDEGLRVIATLNFSDDIATVIRSLRPSLRVLTIDRSHLASRTPIEILNPPPGDVHVLKLHGGPVSGVVLGRDSFDRVALQDYHYSEMMTRLFEDHTVLIVGSTLQDVPVRNAAAYALRRFPVASRTHYSIMPARPGTDATWWEARALATSYGVQALFYDARVDHSDAANILLSTRNVGRLDRLNSRSSLVSIADALDLAGDYEAGAQNRWFGAHADDLVRRILGVRRIGAHGWSALARIERHLRHFLWFVLPDQSRQEVRRAIWARVAQLWKTLRPEERNALWRTRSFLQIIGRTPEHRDGSLAARGIFEFALGYYEVAPLDRDDRSAWRREFGEWRSRLARLVQSDAVLGARVTVAQRLWSSPLKREELQVLRFRAIAGRWDAVEAKLALDVCEQRFQDAALVSGGRSPRDWAPELRDELRDLASDAMEVARAARSIRREHGAAALLALVVPALEGERLLLAAHHRLVDGGTDPEPTAVWALYIGLLAVFVDHYAPAMGVSHESVYGEAYAWLLDRCGRVILPADVAVVRTNYAPYWERFHTTAAGLAPPVAERAAIGLVST